MRTFTKLVPLVLFGAATAVQACGSITNDTPNADGTGEFPVKGVIRGVVTYSGPAPCSQNGHIVGNAILLVFDRRNPPPPAGLANTAVNFVAISGDTLFASQPRTPDDVRRCPDPSQNVVTSASYTIAPMDPGSYVIQGFYDYTGDFLPTFKIRNLPEATDVGGGYIDINDATSLVPDTTHPIITDGGVVYQNIQKQSDPNYQPIFLPVDIGIPGQVSASSQRGVPTFTMPPQGFIRDNVAVTIGARLPLARPYFYPEGVVFPTVGAPPKNQALTNPQVQTYGSAETLPSPGVATPGNPDANPAYQPVLTFPASYQPYAQPTLQAASFNGPDVVNEYQSGFPELVLHFGVPASEATVASDTTSLGNPFHMQLDGPDKGGAGNGGIYVWWDGRHNDDPRNNFIPEGTIPKMWPLVVLAKLVDDPTHANDPQGVIAQGSDGKAPIVIIQGITLGGDYLIQLAQERWCLDTNPGGNSCANLLPKPGPGVTSSSLLSYPDPSNLQDHVTVLVRPSALCFDPQHIDDGGTLVLTHKDGPYPPSDKHDRPTDGGTTGPIVDPTSLLDNPQLKGLLNGQIAEACLPPGRYGINMVYPTGQAWTVPNEAGHCAIGEGITNIIGNDAKPGNCSLKSRPVLNSQGTRAVVEVLDQDPNDPTKPDPYCHDGVHNVPNACLPH